MDKTQFDKEQFLVIDGGEVKTGDEGLVSGLGIVFGSENQPDRSEMRDFFTTDSKISRKSSFEIPLYWEHGLKGYDDPIGEATLTQTDRGWFAQAQLDLNSEEGKKFYDLVKTKQYGFSTGSMSHLVRRESKGNNTHFLKKWPASEISLVEMPAEARALVQSIKSLSDLEIGQVKEEIKLDSVITNTSATNANITLAPGASITTEAKLLPTQDELETSTTVAFYQYGGDGVWEPDSGVEMPEWVKDTKNVKAVELKYAAGSINYQLFTGDDGGAIDINVNQYTDAASVIAAIQGVLDQATSAVQVEQLVEDFEDSIDPYESTEPDEMKNFDERVAAIVKSMLNGTDERISELEKQLADKENDVADLKSKLETRDEDLANAQKLNAQLEILAGAQETLNKYKGK